MRIVNDGEISVVSRMWRMMCQIRTFPKDLMKEQSDLTPIVEKYNEYKQMQTEYRGQS